MALAPARSPILWRAVEILPRSSSSRGETLSSGSVALSAHLVVREFARWPRVLQEERRLLEERFGIGHVTLQPEAAMEVVVPMPRP